MLQELHHILGISTFSVWSEFTIKYNALMVLCTSVANTKQFLALVEIRQYYIA